MYEIILPTGVGCNFFLDIDYSRPGGVCDDLWRKMYWSLLKFVSTILIPWVVQFLQLWVRHWGNGVQIRPYASLSCRDVYTSPDSPNIPVQNKFSMHICFKANGHAFDGMHAINAFLARSRFWEQVSNLQLPLNLGSCNLILDHKVYRAPGLFRMLGCNKVHCYSYSALCPCVQHDNQLFLPANPFPGITFEVWADHLVTWPIGSGVILHGDPGDGAPLKPRFAFGLATLQSV